MTDYYVAWWNVENRFAKVNDPERSEKLERTLAKELTGWTQAVLNKKLKQLANIIKQMNCGRGPDILGVCEVESKPVLLQLVDTLAPLERDYQIIHADTKDNRGIDVAFIYDGAKFKTKPGEIFNHFILRRNATRDLVQVSFYTKPADNRLVCIGNHWPSRLGGELESEPYRILAGETLSYWHQRIGEVFENEPTETAVLAMGDFNDEPFNRSLVEYALSERVERRVKSKRSQNPYFLNLMWPFMGQGLGSNYYEGQPGVLDQFLVNRALLRTDSPFEVDQSSVAILRFPEMVLTSGTNKGGPRRFSRPSEGSSFDEGGYSDHFPLGMVIKEQ